MMENSGAGGPTMHPTGLVSAKLLLRVLHECPDQFSWIESKLELRIASWELCVACQEESSLAMRVGQQTPLRILWMPHGPRISSRVPGVRPVKLEWSGNPTHFEGRHCTKLLDRVNWANSLISLSIAGHFNESISGVTWPPRLEALKFGDKPRYGLQQPILGVRWPRSLKELDLGAWYGALSGVKLPDSLEALTMTGFSDQPLRGVRWVSVKKLSLPCFDEYLGGIEWPVALEELTLERCNQPIHECDEIVWPNSLKRLYFGMHWKQSIVEHNLPDSLEKLDLGSKFCGAIVGVVWPSTLKELWLGSFDGTVDGVVWPNLLETLFLGYNFNQPIVGVKWPDSLQELDFGGSFNQPIVSVKWPSSLRKLRFRSWPDSLQELDFGSCSQPIDGVKWPSSLRKLSFKSFTQPIVGVTWPDSLEELDFGSCSQPIDGVKWPSSLRKLSFKSFNQPIVGVTWPDSLQELDFGHPFKQSLHGIVWPTSLRRLNAGRGNRPTKSYDVVAGQLVESRRSTVERFKRNKLHPA